ncbi:hypothetical protein CDD83_6833 [Cordyceps sp. RAO-2017]|nr:hypothetical protein CDD83_6833 [Cordyceps sp. RAO-2017]
MSQLVGGSAGQSQRGQAQPSAARLSDAGARRGSVGRPVVRVAEAARPAVRAGPRGFTDAAVVAAAPPGPGRHKDSRTTRRPA